MALRLGLGELRGGVLHGKSADTALVVRGDKLVLDIEAVITGVVLIPLD